MFQFDLKTDVCVLCCGLTVGSEVNKRLRRKSYSNETVQRSTIASQEQLQKAGVTRSCHGQLSICWNCIRNWSKPDYNRGSLTFPKVNCHLFLFYIKKMFKCDDFCRQTDHSLEHCNVKKHFDFIDLGKRHTKIKVITFAECDLEKIFYLVSNFHVHEKVIPNEIIDGEIYVPLKMFKHPTNVLICR